MVMGYITITSPNSASILFYGNMYNHLSNVYLSSGSVQFPNLSAVNSFTNLVRVSAICPSFSGYNLPSNYFSVIDNNKLVVDIPNILSGNGLVDVIFLNAAGYTKISDKGYYINFSSAPGNQIYTIDNNELVTIDGKFIVTI